MVGLSAFQGVLGQEVQTHWTHHLAGALQMSHINIRKYLIHISANIFLKPLSSSPIIYVCNFPWNLDCHCQFKVWVYRTHHLARALQRISNFPVFVFLWFSCIWNFRVSPTFLSHPHWICDFLACLLLAWPAKFMQICFKLSTQSLFNWGALKPIFRRSEKNFREICIFERGQRGVF